MSGFRYKGNSCHSERYSDTFAYKLKYDALKHQGKITDDITSCQVGTKYDTDSAKEIARKEGTSRRQIFRYIRLINLNERLLDYLDQGRID